MTFSLHCRHRNLKPSFVDSRCSECKQPVTRSLFALPDQYLLSQLPPRSENRNLLRRRFVVVAAALCALCCRDDDCVFLIWADWRRRGCWVVLVCGFTHSRELPVFQEGVLYFAHCSPMGNISVITCVLITRMYVFR